MKRIWEDRNEFEPELHAHQHVSTQARWDLSSGTRSGISTWTWHHHQIVLASHHLPANASCKTRPDYTCKGNKSDPSERECFLTCNNRYTSMPCTLAYSLRESSNWLSTGRDATTAMEQKQRARGLGLRDYGMLCVSRFLWTREWNRRKRIVVSVTVASTVPGTYCTSVPVPYSHYRTLWYYCIVM